MERGVQRWVVDISKWEPSPHDFSSALSLLPQHEHFFITRFIRMEDRKRALVSRFLQYALVHELLGIPFDEITINRTVEGKPYLEYDKVGLEFPNFNFNVSHHGDFVAIASEPLCLVGLDIVSCVIPLKETVLDFVQNFSSYFSHLEWDNIVNAGSSDDILAEFYRYWCLKEAYVKAIGSGLAYGLDKVEFHNTRWTSISVKINGEDVKEWKFWLVELGKRHWVSIARGHPRSATESYKRTLKRSEFNNEDYHKGLHLPSVDFVFKTVEELILLMNSKRC
ncbi:L-aminoadipate-semialdehyde dehydrogenase-phosphopantetheinyl transferase-like [Juglans microcarpa x Juglans regia]|uniref:L-aminoadipate-semialdehyde dehydrogenase-phosphopantetheinyl transferase-like n=1 Tax=Juglans microcarpa x Juglans regia TaxID=2249226 RepID=UPI001B7F6F06|nr:L-aminoadipate-semialdehyde dehydrogenase-phosphopantetheinyl transferase-like [Juglans microcarpa x Juglans regia]